MSDKPATPTPGPQMVAAEVHDRTDAEEAIGLDAASLDPNHYYRWVHSRPQRISRMFARGGTFVSRTEDKVKPLVEQGGGADDRIYNGDTILMKFPRERIEKRRKQIADTTRALLAAPAQQFRQKATDARVEITTKEMKG